MGQESGVFRFSITKCPFSARANTRQAAQPARLSYSLQRLASLLLALATRPCFPKSGAQIWGSMIAFCYFDTGRAARARVKFGQARVSLPSTGTRARSPSERTRISHKHGTDFLRLPLRPPRVPPPRKSCCSRAVARIHRGKLLRVSRHAVAAQKITVFDWVRCWLVLSYCGWWRARVGDST